jgi:hypothetical protein
VNDFLPTDYEVPQKSGNYMKFQDGENKFRFLSSPILGWETWEEAGDGSRKPKRNPMNKPFSVNEVEDGDPTKVKHFWAAVVWNYNEEKIQILEITQKGIQKSLRALSASKDWGSPLDYDILVTKTGQKLETEYQVNPVPPRELDKGVKQLYKDMKIDLEALFKGDDPFADKSEEVNLDDVPDNL